MSSKSDRPSTPPSSSPESSLKGLGEDIGKKMYEWGQIDEDIRALSIGNSFVEDDEKINQQKAKIQNALHALFESFFTETEEVKERIDTKKKEYLKVYGQFYDKSDKGEEQLNKRLSPIKQEIKKLLDIANFLSGEIGKILASIIDFYQDSRYRQCLTEIIANELETTSDSIKGKNCSQKSLEHIVFRKIAPSGTEMYSGDDTTKSMGIRSLGIAISTLVREVMSSDHLAVPTDDPEEFGEKTSPGMRLEDLQKKDGHGLPEDDGIDDEVTQVSYRPGIEGGNPDKVGHRRSRLSRKERKKATEIRRKNNSRGESQGAASEQSPTSTIRPGTVAELFAPSQHVEIIPSNRAQDSAPAPESESTPESQPASELTPLPDSRPASELEQEPHVEKADDVLTAAVVMKAQEFNDSSDSGVQDDVASNYEDEEDLSKTIVREPKASQPEPESQPEPAPQPEPAVEPIPEPEPQPGSDPEPEPEPTPPPQSDDPEVQVTTPSPWLAERKPKQPTTHGGVPIPIQAPGPSPQPEHISTATRNGVLATAGIALVAIAGLVLAPTMGKDCSSQTDTTAGDTSASTTGTTGSTQSESEEPPPEAKKPPQKEKLSGKVTIDTEHDAFKAYKARIARAKTHASHMTKIAQSTEFKFDGTETVNQKKMIILQEMINVAGTRENGHFKYNKFTRISLERDYQRSLNLLKAEIEKGDVDVNSENFADAKRYTEIRMLMNAIQHTVDLKPPADVEGYTISKSRVDNPAYWAFQKYEKQVPGLYACGTQALEEIDRAPFQRKNRGYVVKTFFDKVEACGEERRAVNPHDGTTSITRSVRTRVENGKPDVMGRMLWELDAVKKSGTSADPDPNPNDPSNGGSDKPKKGTTYEPKDSNLTPIPTKNFNKGATAYTRFILDNKTGKDEDDKNEWKELDDRDIEVIEEKSDDNVAIELNNDDIFVVPEDDNYGEYNTMAKMWDMKRKAETRRPLPPPVPKRKVENKHTTYSQMHKLFMASQTNNTETPEPTYAPAPIKTPVQQSREAAVAPKVVAQPAAKYVPTPATAPSPAKKKSLWARTKAVFAKPELTPEQIEREELKKAIPKKGFFRSLWS